MSAVWLIGTSCLVRISKNEDAVNAALAALDKTDAVCCIGYICGMEHEQIKKLHGNGDWSKADRFEEISKKLTPLLQEGVDSESVFDHPSPDEFLLAWNWMAGQDEYRKWFDQMSADSKKLAKYVNQVMAIRRQQEGFSGWGGELDSPFFQGLEKLDDTLLTDDGKWAKDFCISSMRRNARLHRGEHIDLDDE